MERKIEAMSRWALLTSAGYFMYRMVRQYIRRLRSRDEFAPLSPGTDLVKCPRCYTYVPIDTAMRTSVKGYTLHFCSSECLEAYRRNHQDIDAHAIEDAASEGMKDEV